MATVTVSVDKLAELLGLEPGTDRGTVMEAMNEFVAENAARDSAAGQRQADERTVAAAISAGKFGPARREFWLRALREDREGATRVLASLAAVPSIDGDAVAASGDPELADKQRVFRLITGQAAPETPVTPVIRQNELRAVAAEAAAPTPVQPPSQVAAAAPAFAPTGFLDLGGAKIPVESEDEAREWALWHTIGRRSGQPAPRRNVPVLPSDIPHNR